MNEAPHRPVSRRTASRLLAWGGVVVAALGIVGVFVGAALPWARFTVFGVPVVWPGIATLWGGIAFSCAALALPRLRVWPLLAIFAGLICVWAGTQGRTSVGRTVARQVLQIQLALAPVNEKLAQVTLPPIEPFASLGPAEAYTGPGGTWTGWGGTALVLGGMLAFAGGRLGRTCAHCRALWPKNRLPELRFCPRCGTDADPTGPPLCMGCRRPLFRGDLYCVRCGTQALTAAKRN